MKHRAESGRHVSLNIMAKVYGDRWKTIEPLGEGGQAHTYVVKDLKAESGIQYALKRLKNVKRLERFKNEVDILRGLSHPNVIKLVDFDFNNDRPYFISELCKGGDLSKYGETYSHDSTSSLELFIEICEGVRAAHQEGVVHRDIKPENILFRELGGDVVVADFGIAYVEDGERQTLTDEAVGPRNFIAPELEDGRADKVSPKSDIYSLGKLLYWLISGGKVFSREKHREEKFDLIEVVSAPASERYLLEHVNLLLDKMIVAEPEKRIDSVSQVIEEARWARSLIERNYNPLSKGLQTCRYCGQASYKLVMDQEHDGSTRLRNFGFNPVSGGETWRILRCSKCGHIELFRKNDWWGPER